jgi:hypothetical protein
MHITRTIVMVALMVALGGAALVLMSGTQLTDSARVRDTAMRVEDNAVVVEDQRPGSVVTVAEVFLAAPGYVVIHEASGAILGSSALLPAGRSNDVQVKLNRPSKENETLSAMLHLEKSADSTFQASTDPPAESRLGGPIAGTFAITSSAPEGGRVRS